VDKFKVALKKKVDAIIKEEKPLVATP